MKVKLRDLTLEQYEKWKETNCPAYDCENKLSCHKCVFNGVDCAINLASCYIYHKDMFSDKFLDQEIEIDCESILTEEEHILTEEEKEYLRAVIRPFRDRVEYLFKIIDVDDDNRNVDRVIIRCQDLDGSTNWLEFPTLKFGKWFKNLKYDEHYALEELGL